MDEAFAGIDWASEEHALCVGRRAGLKLEGEFFAHDEAGIEELVARMRALGVVRVAIERPDGLLVDRLLEAGLHGLADPPQQAEGDPAPLSRPPAASPTASTPSSSPSWRAPTPTASEPWRPTPTRPRRCGR